MAAKEQLQFISSPRLSLGSAGKDRVIISNSQCLPWSGPGERTLSEQWCQWSRAPNAHPQANSALHRAQVLIIQYIIAFKLSKGRRK